MALQDSGKPLFVGQDKSSQADAELQVWFVGWDVSFALLLRRLMLRPYVVMVENVFGDSVIKH